ncbi:MAG: hypothetical protein EBR38_05340 [Flavobacteriaceae bacterium]|nr:hypothetical protein [Flavobacteriaceae bacterium]
MAISLYYVHICLIFLKQKIPSLFWLFVKFFGAISSYPLQSTLKSVGFPLLSGLEAADALVISNNHSKMEL